MSTGMLMENRMRGNVHVRLGGGQEKRSGRKTATALLAYPTSAIQRRLTVCVAPWTKALTPVASC